MIYNKIYDTIGNTPIVKIDFCDANCAEIYAKLEFFNPASSVKDRIAKNMILSMLADGTINKDTTIVEPTSGNTGIAVAMISASLGMKCILTMPSSMSIERQKLLKAYGATLVLTEPANGMPGAIAKANELCEQENHVTLAQFDSKYNAPAHAETTAKEIIADFDSLDAFVAGIGTGGTVTGNSKVLKDAFSGIKVVGVEPADSPFLSQGTKGPHKIQGIGAGFRPAVYNDEFIDELRTVTLSDAYEYARKCATTQGILLGVSGGAALSVAHKIALELGAGKKVLFVAPDNGERYLSTELYEV